jgi:7-carboxy-7-deazaguanine synthase
MTLIINEIFYSIQGESLFSGLPCIFIRLTGCNLRCSYCDTQGAYAEGTSMSIPEILDNISSTSCSLIEVTGGEPLAQKCTPALVDKLIEAGYEVLLETNGTFDIDRINSRCIKIVDIKCPSSGESHQNDLNNLTRLAGRDQIKFVIGDHADYSYARDILNRLDPSFPLGQVLFSPVYGRLSPDRLAQWMLGDSLNVRLHLQLHKFIWPGRDRGV